MRSSLAWLAALALMSGALPALAQPVTATPPEEIAAVKGVVTVTLDARAEPIDFGPVTIDGILYNHHFAGPTLRAKPGDLLKITLVNHLNEVTNLHFHGMETSPRGHSDNVHVMLQPGKSQLYEVRIPKTQPPGVYWYHAHIHGVTERQVMHGLAGAIMIEGFKEQFPALHGITEKLLLLQEVTYDNSPDPVIAKQFHDRVQMINGTLSTHLTMRPGETQLWHVSNNSANLYIDLAIPGHRFRILGEDGSTGARENDVEVLHIKPAGRFAVLVDAGEAGLYPLLSRKVPTGGGAERTLDRTLGEIEVSGEKMNPIPTIDHFPPGVDLSQVKPDMERSFVFSESKNGDYLIDGRKFDMERIDTRVPLGNVERWTIRNESDDLHVFHIHQVHFQVLAINDQPKIFDGYVDTVQVPERGTVTLMMPFTHREIVGHFMYHCHVLDHEDHGMMAHMEVYDPTKPPRSTSFYERVTRYIKGGRDPLWASICRSDG